MCQGCCPVLEVVKLKLVNSDVVVQKMLHHVCWVDTASVLCLGHMYDVMVLAVVLFEIAPPSHNPHYAGCTGSAPTAASVRK